MEKDLFDLMSKMYGEMQSGFSSLNQRLDNLETKVDNLETEVKKTNIIIENDIKPSIDALFDGYKQNSETITKIEDDIKDLTISVNNLK